MYKIPGGKRKEVDPPAHDSPAIVRTRSFRILIHTVALSGYYRDGYSLPSSNQRHECKPTCVFCKRMNLSREWPRADLTLAAPLCLFSVGEGVKKSRRRDKRYELLSLSHLQGQHPLSSTQWLVLWLSELSLPLFEQNQKHGICRWKGFCLKHMFLIFAPGPDYSLTTGKIPTFSAVLSPDNEHSRTLFTA